MCTLAVAFQTDRRWPLLVAANRDERLVRAAEGWALREPARGPRYAAPCDLVGGGTWIGISAFGLFAALTNHFAPGPEFPDPSRRSRGELVVRALAQRDAAAARDDLAREDAARYNPFHLVVADPARAILWRYDGERAELSELAPGLHVVTEADAEGRSPRAELVRARWPLDPAPARLGEVLVQHAPSPRDATCIHLDHHGYGTRSATVLRLAPTLSASELWVADGRPCTSPLEDRSRLLAALARSA
jgi:uncharacterized protein with NRDE domain